MFPMSAIQMRMKRNCEADMLVAAVVIHAAFQCATMWLIAYLKSSEADTHDVHICGSVVVVFGVVVLGSRMVCSDSKSTARLCVMRVLLVAETASRKRKSCALPYDGQLLAVALLRQTRVCRAVPPSGKSQMARFLMTTPPKPKVFGSSAVVRLCGAVRAPRRRSRRGRNII